MQANLQFTACWFLWRDRNAVHTVHVDPIPGDLLRERYSLTENDDVTTFFYDAFWIALRNGLVKDGRKLEPVVRELGGDNLGWLPTGLNVLERLARDIADGQIMPTFSAIYSAASDIDPVVWGPSSERDRAQYRAFSETIRQIAVDLHFLGTLDSANTKISAIELQIASNSVHWTDQIWVNRNVAHRICLLDNGGAEILLSRVANDLVSKVTEFSERGECWAQLADFARLYDDDRQHEFLRHSAECLVGYGYRKDLGAIEILDALVEVSSVNLDQTHARFEKIAPIIDVVTEFTDGDETDNIRSELIGSVAKIMPDWLPSLYKHHLEADEYQYADECLIEFTKMANLETHEGASLARTLLDERTLGVLEDRSANESTARALLEMQNAFLGRTDKPREEVKRSEDELSDSEKDAAKIDAKSFGPENFADLVEASIPIHYNDRKQFLSRWLNHWKDQRRGPQALHSILEYFEKNEITYDADEVLDEAFRVSLTVEGKDAAYPWLVRAHIHRNGWLTHWTSKKEIMERLAVAAQLYSDRWEEYIKDTSAPAPYYRRRNSGFVLGHTYLVKFLMLVGQTELANRIATSLVETLVEEVRDQPIPKAPWFAASNEPIALAFLFQRLNWPVPFTRWRAAKEIRNLLENPTKHSVSTRMLLRYLESCKTESEICSLLSIVFLTSPSKRPSHSELASRICCPSLLADIILERTYGAGKK